MTIPDPADLPVDEQLSTRILAIDGVAALFTPANSAARFPSVVGVPFIERRPAVRVQTSAATDTSVITARIATERDTSTPDTVRAVADTLLRHAGTALPAVSVQVAQIHWDVEDGDPPR